MGLKLHLILGAFHRIYFLLSKLAPPGFAISSATGVYVPINIVMAILSNRTVEIQYNRTLNYQNI